MKERQAVPLLLTLLTPSLEDIQQDETSYENWKVNVEAVKALGEIGDKRATRPLLNQMKMERLLENGNDEPGVDVIEALGKIGDTKAVRPLLQLLPSNDTYVRWRSLEALGRIKTPEVVEPLLHALQPEEDNHVRLIAIEWLGKMQDRRALPALQKILVNEDMGLRDMAAVAIGRIDSGGLLSLLEDKDVSIRRAVISGLRAVGCKQAVPRLIPMIADEALGYRALDALGDLGTPELLPRLESRMRDPNFVPRRAARRAVIAIKRRYGL